MLGVVGFLLWLGSIPAVYHVAGDNVFVALVYATVTGGGGAPVRWLRRRPPRAR